MWNNDINNIEEVVIYLNSELSKGRTQKDIEINDFKVNERVIAKRLISRGYKKIDNQYIKNSENEIKVINNDVSKYDNSNTKVISNDYKEYDKSDTLVIDKKEIQSKIIGLAENYDKILEIIRAYDKNNDAQYDKGSSDIIIHLPIETKTDFRATIRVNNIVWEQFSEFANAHKEFTKRDLISMALKEYIENHK